MALYPPINIAAGNDNPAAGSYSARTTPTFTPAAGARLFVFALVARADTSQGAATLSISDNRGHVWTQVGQDGFAPPAGGVSTAALWTTVASGQPMTVTVSSSLAPQLIFQIHPYQITADEGTPLIVQSTLQRTVAGGAWSVSLPASVTSGNAVLGIITGPTATISPGTGSGYTELYDVTSGSGQVTSQAQYRMTGTSPACAWQGLNAVAATKYGFVVELAEPVTPPEEHEGAAHVAGGGTVEARGAKRAAGALQINASGTITASGVARESAAGGAQVSGGGSISGAGAKHTSGAAVIAGGGSVASAGSASEGASGGIQLSGGGTQASVGRKDAAGEATVTVGGTVQTWASKSVPGQARARGGGGIDARGSSTEREEHSGGVQVSGGGEAGAHGRKSAGGAAAPLSGGGSTRTAGRKLAAAALQLAGGGSVLALGRRTARGSLYVAGGGRIRARGHNPETQPVPPYAATLAVSSRPASLTVVTLAAALSVSTRPAGLTVEDA